MSGAERMPIILLDNLGYSFYRNTSRRPFLHAGRFDVRLVTDLTKLHEARGRELESVVGVPMGDELSMREAVEFQHRSGGREAARLVSISETLLLPAARLREELGLPGPTVAGTAGFRDKVVMKETLRRDGIRVPQFAPFSVEAAHRLLRSHSRLIAKPRLGAGSIGVTALNDHADVADFAEANEGWLEDFEVEEYIDGNLYHVDSVVDRGRVVAATAGLSLDPTTSYEHLRPYRDVALGESPRLKTLLEFNEAVLGSFPDFAGVTHHEVFLQGDQPVFCEIAARAGGGGVVAGFRSRTGADLREVALSAQITGSVPAALPVSPHLTGYVLIYTGVPVHIADPWIVETTITRRETVPRSWADATTMISVRGDTEESVAARLDEVVERTDDHVQ